MIDIKDNPSLVSYSNTNTEIKPEILEKVKYSKFAIIFNIVCEILLLVGILYLVKSLFFTPNIGLASLVVIFYLSILLSILFIFSSIGFIISNKIIKKFKENNEKVPKFLRFMRIVDSLIFYSFISAIISYILTGLIFSQLGDFGPWIGNLTAVVLFGIILSTFFAIHSKRIFVK